MSVLSHPEFHCESACEIDPAATLAPAPNGAEERAGDIDGNCIEDPTLDIAGGSQHPFCGAGHRFVAEHGEDVSERVIAGSRSDKPSGRRV